MANTSQAKPRKPRTPPASSSEIRRRAKPVCVHDGPTRNRSARRARTTSRNEFASSFRFGAIDERAS